MYPFLAVLWLPNAAGYEEGRRRKLNQMTRRRYDEGIAEHS